MLDDHPLFRVPATVPDDLAERAREQGWPADLVARAATLRVPRSNLEFWLNAPFITADDVAKTLDRRELFHNGALTSRFATWQDHEAVAELYANAAEYVGDWTVTTERSPNPFAQMRLQDNAYMNVIERRGVVLAATIRSGRNCVIGGERLSVFFQGGWRVREGFRGLGLSNMLREAPGPSTAWFGLVNYWYERTGNQSRGWLDKMRTEIERRDWEGQGPEPLDVTVYELVPGSNLPAPGGFGITRAAARHELGRCCELIDATHGGLDLFRPYSVELLERHLDDQGWGPKPSFLDRVYSWDDFAVQCEGDEILACAGLWDRGRDQRDVWVHRETGERAVHDPTAVIDWGHAPGRADAMASLLVELLDRSRRLGRSGMLVALETAPDVGEALAAMGVEMRGETRTLQHFGFNDGMLRIDAALRRPYTDLAYW